MEIVQATERVASQDVGRHVVWLALEHDVGPRERIVHAARGQQVRARLQLQVRVFREQVGGPHIFTEGLRVSQPFVHLSKPGAGLAESRVHLHGVAVFNHRVLQLVLCDVAVAACEELTFARLGVAPASRHAADDGGHHQQERHTSRGRPEPTRRGTRRGLVHALSKEQRALLLRPPKTQPPNVLQNKRLRTSRRAWRRVHAGREAD